VHEAHHDRICAHAAHGELETVGDHLASAISKRDGGRSQLDAIQTAVNDEGFPATLRTMIAFAPSITLTYVVRPVGFSRDVSGGADQGKST
jgi:hypothetical protein